MRCLGIESLQIEGVGLFLDAVRGQGNGVVDKIARGIDALAQGWIAHHVEVSERRNSQSLAQALSSGLLRIEDEFGPAGELDSRVEGKHAGERGRFHPALEAVGPGVGRVKWFVGLEDEVGLARDPYAIGDEMVGEDGRILLIVGLIRLSLVDLGQRFPLTGPWRWRGELRPGEPVAVEHRAARSLADRKACRHRITAESNSQRRIKTPRRNEGPRKRLIDKTLTNVTGH